MADPIDYDKLSDSIARALRRSGGGGAPTGPSGPAPEAGSEFSKGLKALGDASFDAAKDLLKAGTENLDAWRQLSKAGSNFSNSVDSMAGAALESRLNLREFADVVTQNGKNLAGLGGSVSRGTEAFSKLSKGFFDSGATDQLKQLGYSSKDLNEVLAIQASTQRSTMGNDAESRRKSYVAAADLAREMDMIAKLTGKNREQQMEEAKKRSTDGQIEAKLRLIGIEQGAEAEAAARAAFQKQFAEAEARGMGQMAKEMFATGTVTSDEAATQYALLGEAAQKTGEQMQHLAKGNIAAAEAASKEADAANARNQRDPTLLRIATLGDAAGTAGNIMKKNVEDNMALHDSIMAVSKSMKPGLTDSTASFGKALEEVRSQIRSSSRGEDATGRNVSGVTRGMVATGIAAENFQAGVASAAMERNAQGKSIAGAAQNAGMGVDQTLRSGGNISTGIQDRARQGLNPTPTDAQSPAAQREASGGIIGAITQGLAKGVNIGADFINARILKVEQLPARAEGGYVAKPEIALIGEAGPEFVLNHTQMKGLIDNVGKTGINNLVKEMPSGNSNQSLNIAELSKTISTTVSSTSGGETTTRRVQSDDSKSAEKEMEALRIKFGEDWQKRKEVLIEGMAVEDRKFSKVQAAMKGDAEAQKIKEEYEAKRAELQKKVEDGIKYEVETKKEQLEEVKKVATEELNLVKIKNGKLLEEDQSATTTILAGKEEERKELIKQAELAKDIIGTSVKGLHQDAIESMLPIGAKMEDFYVDMDGNLQSFANDSLNSFVTKTASISNELLTGIPTTEAEILAKAGATDGMFKPVATEDEMFAQADMQEFLTGIKSPDAAMRAGATNSVTGIPTTESEMAKAAGATKATPNVGFDLNALNLPGFTQKITQAATPPRRTASPGRAINQETGEEYTPVDPSKPKPEGAKPEGAKPEGAKPGGKDATLNDLLMSLNHLNKSMGQLIAQQEELGRKQIQATQANSSNVYAKQ